MAKAVTALDTAGGFLLADGTGVGKTRQLLALGGIYADRGKKVLIVSKAQILGDKWASGEVGGSFGKDPPAMGVSLTTSKGGPLEPGKPVLTTYENLKGFAGHVDPDTVVLFDEAHSLKNAGAARSQEGRAMAERAGGVVYATATPADDPLDVAYLFRTRLFGDRPWEDVRKDFSVTKHGAAEVVRRVDEMFGKLTEQGLMVKREISLDGLDVEVGRVSLPPEAHAEMAAVAAATDPKDRAQVLMRSRRLQEVYKVKAAADDIEKDLKAGRSVILFCARANPDAGSPVAGTPALVRAELARRGISDVVEYHGGEGGQGQAAVKAFQAGEARVFVTTPDSGGTGINLDDTVGDRPRTMLVMTAPFSALDQVQMAGRAVRLTTKSKAKLKYLFADTAVDDWNANLAAGAMANLGAIVAGQTNRLKIEHRTPAPEAAGVTAASEFASFWQGPFRGERGGTYWLPDGASDSPENRQYGADPGAAEGDEGDGLPDRNTATQVGIVAGAGLGAAGGPVGSVVGAAVGGLLGWLAGSRHRAAEADARGDAEHAAAGDPAARDRVKTTVSAGVEAGINAAPQVPAGDAAATRAAWDKASAGLDPEVAGPLGDHVEALATERDPATVRSVLGGIAKGIAALPLKAAKLVVGAIGRFAAEAKRQLGPYGWWAGSIIAATAVAAAPALAVSAGLLAPAYALASAPLAAAGFFGMKRLGSVMYTRSAKKNWGEPHSERPTADEIIDVMIHRFGWRPRYAGGS